MAEGGDTEAALVMLTAATEDCPESGSVWNNLGQVRRMREDSEGALEALDKAIALEDAWLDKYREVEGIRLTASWNRHKGTIQNALLQRAAMRKAAGNERGAENDLAAAAAHGSKLAMAMTSSTNPYSTMCHAAVASMMKAAMNPSEEQGES
jgi:tetratricopeptide (TPR) repeat protein